MANKRFNADQQKAIDSRKGNFLVSAGAGSGKTTVLTQRIYDIVSSGDASISEFLVLTFTEKAAYEMKQRARDLILSDPKTAIYAAEMEQADITTFDSFARRIVKKYHDRIGLPKEIDIVNQGILLVEKKRILDSLLEKRYKDFNDAKKDAFASLLSEFCFKDDKTLTKLILDIERMADLEEDPKAFLSNYEKRFFSKDFINKTIDELEEKIRNLLLEQINKEKELISDPDLVDKDVAFLQGILEASDYDELVEKLSVSFIRKKGGSDEDAAIREKIKKAYFGAAKSFASAGKKEDILAFIEDSKPKVLLCVEITLELMEEMERWKRSKKAYDFSDIAKFARQIASIPEIREKLKKQYRYIMVDEYQDTSDLQEGLISLIAEDNVFAVGDMKQSIYRFRKANPTIFKAKLDAYSKGNGGELISLNANYRSRSQVIEEINRLFLSVMKENCGGVDYSNGQQLSFGNHGYDATQYDEKYGLSLAIFPRDKEEESSIEYARHIASDIAKRLKEGYLVFDKGGHRPCKPSDFAILIAAKTDFDDYRTVFNEAGIPLEVSKTEKAEGSDVVIIFSRLLELTSIILHGGDEERKKHLFACLSRSYLFQEDDELLYKELSTGAYRLSPIIRKIEEAREKLLRMSLIEQVSYLIDEYHFIDKLPLIGEVRENYERILSLYDLAKTGAKLDWNLQDLISYFADLDQYEISFEAETGKTDQEAVRLMSIHASKGLEFPIVYYPDLPKRIFPKDLNKKIRASNVYGITLPNYSSPSLPSNSHLYLLDCDLEKKETLSERIRLFYVALTRAKEEMVLVMPYDEDEGFDLSSYSPLSRDSLKSFIEMVALSSISISNIYEMGNDLPSFKEEGGSSSFSLSFKQIDKKAETVDIERPSKKSHERIDEGKLAYGERMHRLLELSSFEDKEAAFIKNEAERKKISKVLSLPLFEQAHLAKAYREYQYVDEEGREGVIDLFLLYEDHIDLVDYKSSSIDDPAYEKQLATYEAYLEKAFHLPIHKYLLSISEGRIRRVE